MLWDSIDLDSFNKNYTKVSMAQFKNKYNLENSFSVG